MSVLEIGSGVNQWHHSLEGAFHFDIDKAAFNLDCLGDCHRLPFKDNSFKTVYIAHVLEHCLNPNLVIQELKRVAEKKIIIVVPNSLFYQGMTEDPGHIYGWTPFTLFRFLSLTFQSLEIKTGFQVRAGKNRIRNGIDLIRVFVYRLLLRQDNELIAVVNCEGCT